MASHRKILFILLTVGLTACQTPMLVFPGKALQGETATATSFDFADQFSLLELEVNPEEPYSVILRTTVIDGALYIDAAKRRRWATQLAMNPQVRIKLGNKIYDAVATRIFDESITTQFLGGRIIYRIDPVNP